MRVLSSLAIKEAYLELQPLFEKKSGLRVDTEWLGMVDIVKRIKAGESADMVIASRKALGELQSLGKVAAVVDLATSGVAVAVKKGAKRPDIGSGEAVKRALRGARSIAYSSCSRNGASPASSSRRARRHPPAPRSARSSPAARRKSVFSR